MVRISFHFSIARMHPNKFLKVHRQLLLEECWVSIRDGVYQFKGHQFMCGPFTDLQYSSTQELNKTMALQSSNIWLRW